MYFPITSVGFDRLRQASTGFDRLRQASTGSANGCGRRQASTGFDRLSQRMWASTGSANGCGLRQAQPTDVGFDRLRQASTGFDRLRQASTGFDRLRQASTGFDRLSQRMWASTGSANGRWLSLSKPAFVPDRAQRRSLRRNNMPAKLRQNSIWNAWIPQRLAKWILRLVCCASGV